MKQFSLRAIDKRIIFYAAAGLLGVLIYLFLILVPSVSNVCVMIKDLREGGEDLEQLREHAGQIAGLTEKREECEENLRRYRERFPLTVDMQAFLQKLSSTAEEPGVTITVLAPLETQNEEGISGFISRKAIRVEARAGYHQIGQFINKLEYSQQFFAVEEINVRAESGDSSGATFRLTVYAYAAA